MCPMRTLAAMGIALLLPVLVTAESSLGVCSRKAKPVWFLCRHQVFWKLMHQLGDPREKEKKKRKENE